MSSRILCETATILVVDDQPVNLGPVVTTLEECGFEIMVAQNGEKGIEIAEQAHPDLILLDALMPGIDGFETCRRLKDNPTTQNIPVIFMTALANTADKIKGFTAGAVDYITKPIQNDELLARVTTHLHIRDLQTRREEQNRELKTTLEHLQRTQSQLIESEKLAGLGKLVANIAHEINTPLSAVSSAIGNMAATLDRFEEHLFALLPPPVETLESDAYVHERLKLVAQLVGLKENAHTIITAITRGVKIAFALKTYASPGLSLGEMMADDLAQSIEAALTLYENQLRQGVTVVRQYTPLPPLHCYPDELQQIWINLIHNALQAMNYAGTLTIACAAHDDQIVVAITDTGCGIPETALPHIFDLFFTTKLTGEGCGLGLSIAKKIVEKHRGAITVESRPGETTFRVSLPLTPSV